MLDAGHAKVYKFDQSSSDDSGTISEAVKKPLSTKKVLAVRCPTCGAASEKKCELVTGQPRSAPHRDRRLIAAD
jgi:hypothetical protein